MKALVVYKNDTTAYNTAYELNDLLLARGLTAETMESRFLTNINCPLADLAFVLGGDGTIIHTAVSLAGRDIPIAGINLGQVGFLSSIEPNELTAGINKILAGNYIIQKRSIVQAGVIRTGKTITKSFAINDLVVKSSAAHPISITIRLNKQLYSRFRGDGLICATPSGSTAYSYSAGGPVIDLNLPALVITPICPHMSNFRSVVVSSDSELEFILDTDYETGLYIDGRKK
ncbi:MAG TPA: NAD(+)/NADH kinase, partial [Syntrophomonadaceae bacterium]|nr:NAD(+)/NADH kinase [Syntrophomonadaceae bacterium]